MNNNYNVHICYYESVVFFEKTAPNAISEHTNFKIFLGGMSLDPLD